jgi:peptidyl-prolyl cis-trans isomerase B (cyclophilin B)
MKIFFASLLAALIAAPFPSIVQQPPELSINDVVAVVETNHGTIKFEMFPDAAPELTRNFAELAQKKYYDGTIFHRVISGFMIQGGDPTGTGRGGESYKGGGLADEEGALKLKHNRGAVSWAKSSLPNSIRSQFFIVHQNSNFLDGKYSVFGRVLEGMDTVDKIAALETDQNDRPTTEAKMLRVYLEPK